MVFPGALLRARLVSGESGTPAPAAPYWSRRDQGTFAHRPEAMRAIASQNPSRMLLVLALGVLHLLVDAASNFVVTRAAGPVPVRDLVWVVLAYNFVAFALQPFIGLLSDRFERPREAMCGGVLLVAASLVTPGPWWVPVGLTGLGNAMFHVGGGALASDATPGRASGPGLFIGPGAIGVVLGSLAGRSAPWLCWPAFAALLACALFTWFFRPGRQARSRFDPLTDGAVIVLVLLLLAIALRALLGLHLSARLASSGQALPFAFAACVGQALGGFAADRAGWSRVAVASLLSSAGLLALADQSPWLAAAGIVLFQAVTGVTLAALYRLLPGQTAFAFGLACLALFAGGLPLILWSSVPLLDAFPSDTVFAVTSAGLVFVALSRLDRLAPRES